MVDFTSYLLYLNDRDVLKSSDILNGIKILVESVEFNQPLADRLRDASVTFPCKINVTIPIHKPDDIIYKPIISTKVGGWAYCNKSNCPIYATTTDNAPSSLWNIVFINKRTKNRRSDHGPNSKYLRMNIPRAIKYIPTTFLNVAKGMNMLHIFKEPNWHKNNIFAKYVIHNDINEPNNMAYITQEIKDGKHTYITNATYKVSYLEYTKWLNNPESILEDTKEAYVNVCRYYTKIHKTYYVEKIEKFVRQAMEYKQYPMICPISKTRAMDPVAYDNCIYSNAALRNYLRENAEPTLYKIYIKRIKPCTHLAIRNIITESDFACPITCEIPDDPCQCGGTYRNPHVYSRSALLAYMNYQHETSGVMKSPLTRSIITHSMITDPPLHWFEKLKMFKLTV